MVARSLASFWPPGPPIVLTDAARGLQVLERMQGRTGLDIHFETGTSPLYPGQLPDAAARLEDAPLSAFGEVIIDDQD